MLWYDQYSILTHFLQFTAVITWNHYKQVGFKWIYTQYKGSNVYHSYDCLFSEDSKVSYMTTCQPQTENFFPKSKDIKERYQKDILSKIFYLMGIILYVKLPSLPDRINQCPFISF